MDALEHDDVGALFAGALDELWEYGQRAVEDAAGEPVVVEEWYAPGVEPGQYDELMAEALARLRRGEGPEAPGPAGAGPGVRS